MVAARHRSPLLGRQWALIGLIAACLILFLGVSAYADFQPSPYTTTNDCTEMEDPVNFVFWGSSAGWGNSAGHVAHHTGWNSDSGFNQQNWTHNACYDKATQRKGGDGYHIRFFWAHEVSGRKWSEGAAHRERGVACDGNPYPYPGHAVYPNGSAGGSGYDQAKRELRDAMKNYHNWSSAYWGNTWTSTQCNGDRASSNGYVIHVQIGSA